VPALPTSQKLPSESIFRTIVGSDGTVWIGTLAGLSSWKDEKLTHYPQLDGQLILGLVEDHEGTVWAGGYTQNPGGKLCAIRGSDVKCVGEDGLFGTGVTGIYEDRAWRLWVQTQAGLWRWAPDKPKYFPLPRGPNYGFRLAENIDGELLVPLDGKLARFVNGSVVGSYSLPGPQSRVGLPNLLRDRDGGVWVGTMSAGLMHLHSGRTDVLTQADGLSGNAVMALFEDRDGNIWVGTQSGLDRFRDYPIVTYAGDQGLEWVPNHTILADKEGSIWFATNRGIAKWKNGQSRMVKGVPLQADPRYQDSAGRVWLAAEDAIGYVQDDRYTPIQGVPKGVVTSICADSTGNIWAATALALVEIREGHVIERIPWVRLGHAERAYSLTMDPSSSGIWLGWLGGGLSHIKNGQVQSAYSVADGLGKGPVTDIRIDSEGTVWAATEGGLSLLKNGQISTLSSANGLPCDRIIWMMEDDTQSVWLYMLCGLVRIARSELDAWIAAPSHKLQVTTFDSNDGVWNIGIALWTKPRATKSPDGKIWFSGDDGIRVLDPRNVGPPTRPPPVQIEQVIAERKIYTALPELQFAAYTRDIEIDFTALSLVAPERIIFRYKLEGRDKDWENVGNRRAAFYNDLSPGLYHFVVIARDPRGAWNDSGASLDFSIAPAYWQTNWFRAACVAAFVALLWALYQLRLRQIRQAFNARLEERVGERTRIARDLHDTLLQSFQGLLLRFQTARELLRTRPAEADKTLESAIDQTAHAITEGREAVQGLRASTVERNDLARAITTLGEEIAAEGRSHASAGLRVGVEGTPRPLHPIVRDEIYRIGSEALRNAVTDRHIGAKTGSAY
jgi:ligand-binding sensor domain-containing protein/signal transduction histidine kinase